MKYRKLGRSGLDVSLIGYGSWALAKKGWGNVNEKEAVKTLELSIEKGINFFDTAPVYGFGKSEEILGKVLSATRKNVIIATKCGLRWNGRGRVFHDLSPDSIRTELESSLKRLKTDYIDLYQIHWPDKRTALHETLDTLKDLKDQGLIRNIGVSNFGIDLLNQIPEIEEITSLQSLYNILQKEAETDLIPFCKKNNLGFICYSPLAQGLLSGAIGHNFKPGRQDVRRLNPLFRNREKFKRGIDFTNNLPVPPAQNALKFLSEQSVVTSILVSTTKVRHLMENIKICE